MPIECARVSSIPPFSWLGPIVFDGDGKDCSGWTEQEDGLVQLPGSSGTFIRPR